MLAGERNDDVSDSDKLQAINNNLRKFTDYYLRHDGVFLLRLIAHNTNGITTTEITRELWDLWYDRQFKAVQMTGIEANELSPLHEKQTID